MKFLNRRRFVAAGSVTAVSAVLVACGNEPLSEEELNPTQIPDVPGAPPTLAPVTGTPGAAPEAPGDTGSGDAPAAPDALVIDALDSFAFEPNEANVAPGQVVKVVNAGFMQHDLVVDDWDVATAMLNGGEEGEITIPADAEVGSTVEFHCSVPGHKETGMFGTFTVVEAGAAPAETDEDSAEETTEEAPADEGAGSSEPVVIDALDSFAFEPKEADVAPGQVVKVVNAGFMQHDLVVDEWDVATAMLNGGEEGEITIPADAEVGSTVEFYCSVPGHKETGMKGTFTVVDAGAAAPAETDEETTDEAAEEESTDAPAAVGSAEPITIDALDSFAFEPKTADVVPGQVVHVVNVGFMQHDLVVDEWDVATAMLNGGEEGEITIPADAEVGSTVEFYCSVPGHKETGMKGTFTVVAGSDAAPADEASEDSAPAASSGDAVIIDALDTFKFEPAEVEVAPGQVVRLVNLGFMEHDLVVDDWDVATAMLKAGEEGEITIPADVEVGATVEFHCSVPGHKESGMKGTFTVVAAGASSEDGEDASPEVAGTPVPATLEAVTVVGTKWEFEPAEFEIAPGGVITFQNNTGMMMGLSSDEWDKNALQPMIKSIGDGQSAEFVVPEDAEIGAEIEFKSNLSEAAKQGMVGKVTIVAADSEGTPAANRRSRRSLLASVFAAR